MSRLSSWPLLVAVLVEVVQAACYDAAGNFSEDLWSHCQRVPQADVDVYYTVTHDFLQIGVHASNVKGWSGVGFGGNGGMKGMQSVIVRQDVSAGKWVVEERFSMWYEEPLMNPTQMVKLMYAREDSAGVTWAVLLPTATCDEGAAQRYTVEDLTRWMQFASGSSHHFGQHSSRTQFVSNLHAAPPKAFDGNDMPIMNLTKAAGINVTSIKNPYICIYFEVAQVKTTEMTIPGEPNPIIGAMEAHLHGPSSQYVHHIVMFNCGPASTNPPSHLFEEDHCEGMPQRCNGAQMDLVWAWAKGGQIIDLKTKDVGYPLSRAWLAMQMHYYNPSTTPGVVDASGGYFYITKIKPANEAGTIVFNAGALPQQYNKPVPPGNEAYLSEVLYVGNDCLRRMFPKKDVDEKINIVGMMHHLHTVGQRQEVVIYRDGANLGPIRDEKAYDFNFQSYEETRLKFIDPSKDSIAMYCQYNTKKGENLRTEPVKFGEQTTAEMCYSPMLYWPRQQGPTTMLWFVDEKNPGAPDDAKNGVYGCGGGPYTQESLRASPTDPSKWEYTNIKYDNKKWEISKPACEARGNLTSSNATNLMAKLMQNSSAVGGHDEDDDNAVLSSGLHPLPLLFILGASASGV